MSKAPAKKPRSVTKPPVIFSLLDTPAFGGAEQYLASHLKFLNQQGCPIFLATNNPKVAVEVEKRVEDAVKLSSNFQIVHAPYLLDAIGNWKGLLKYFWATLWAITWLIFTLTKVKDAAKKDGRTVVCLLPGFSDRLTFSPFIKLIGLKLIWIEIGPLEPTFKKNWGFPKFLYRLTQHFPDHFVTTSKFTLESMVTAGQIPADKITLVYPGIKLLTAKQVTSFQKKGKSERHKRKLENCTLIGYVGRLASENEVELVIQAVAKVLAKKSKKTPTNLHLLIIGDGPERQYYQKIAQDLKISQFVHFTGFVSEEEKFSLLSVCDIFTFTRAWELDGFGMTTIEAMSLGVPVITPKFGPQREIITDGVSGINFEPHSAENLAEKIEFLITNPQKRQKIGAAGFHRVQYFAEEKCLQEMWAVVQKFA